VGIYSAAFLGVVKTVNFPKRINDLEPSATMAVIEQAQCMRAQGINVISFGAGEPDFDTPQYIRDAAVKAMVEGKTRYTPGSGTQELKAAIAAKLKRDNGLEYKPEQIIVSNGAKHSLFNLCMTLCEEGDEVIVFRPYWVTFPEVVKLAGARPVYVDLLAEHDYQIQYKALFKAISAKTKAIIINSPSNPTGKLFTEESYKTLLSLAEEYDFWIISDECYEALTYDKPHLSIASLPGGYERTFTVQSLSKTFAMTGWRIGYVAGNVEVVQAMARFQGQATGCPNSIAQAAAVEALTQPPIALESWRQEYRARRDVMVETLNRIPGVKCARPEGAFYVFPDVSELYGLRGNGHLIRSSVDFANYLLETEAVATVPGVAFGADNHIRLSYATSMEEIKEGLARIIRAVEKLQ